MFVLNRDWRNQVKIIIYNLSSNQPTFNNVPFGKFIIISVLLRYIDNFIRLMTD